MFKKIALGLLVAVVAFLAYVSTRESKFHYERSGVIQASSEKIFPYISNFKLGEAWSPYEKMDPAMKRTFLGEDGKVGSKMEFESKKAGSGWLEILKIVPNESVEMALHMTAPFAGDNLIEYKLTPEGPGTRFTWTMSGDGGFMTKLISVFVDCEKMIGSEFTNGINNLKTVMEAQK